MDAVRFYKIKLNLDVRFFDKLWFRTHLSSFFFYKNDSFQFKFKKILFIIQERQGVLDFRRDMLNLEICKKSSSDLMKKYDNKGSLPNFLKAKTI